MLLVAQRTYDWSRATDPGSDGGSRLCASARCLIQYKGCSQQLCSNLICIHFPGRLFGHNPQLAWQAAHLQASRGQRRVGTANALEETGTVAPWAALIAGSSWRSWCGGWENSHRLDLSAWDCSPIRRIATPNTRSSSHARVKLHSCHFLLPLNSVSSFSKSGLPSRLFSSGSFLASSGE